MDYNSNDETQKKLCIRFDFNHGMTPEEALAHTKNSFPSVNLKEVNELYEVFKTGGQGNASLTIDQINSTSQDNSPSAKKMKLENKNTSVAHEQENRRSYFETLPAELVDGILVHSSTEDQKILHKTNREMSSFISSKYNTYEGITVMLREKTIQMRITEQKTMVKVGEKRKFEAEDDGSGGLSSLADISETIQSLKSIFSLKNIKIGTLTIRYEKNDTIELKRKEFYSSFQEMLDGLKSNVHVERLNIAIDDSDSLLDILNKLKPGPLKNINFLEFSRPEYKVFHMEKIVCSEHWQYIEYIESCMCILNIQLSELANVATVFANVIEYTIEDILSYKNKLLESSKVISHTFWFKVPVGLIEAFKPFKADQDITRQTGTVIDINGKKLHFKLGDTYGVSFERRC